MNGSLTSHKPQRYTEAGMLLKMAIIVQQPKAIYLANPVSSDKVVVFPVDTSFGCI